MEKLMFFISKMLLHLQFRSYKASVCGHMTKRKGLITDSDGTPNTMTLPIGENATTPYCIQCIDAMAIRCAWCGERIIISDPITLMGRSEGEFPEYAVRYKEDPRFAVGCLRMGCGPGMMMSGHWYPPGRVRRMPSPLEIAEANPGKAVLMNDLATGKAIIVEVD